MGIANRLALTDSLPQLCAFRCRALPCWNGKRLFYKRPGSTSKRTG
jgi:hypothetical protein